MGIPAPSKATYQDLHRIPENMIGEIINGELQTTPRPSYKHALVTSSLGSEIVGPYYKGRGGPGGWIILNEPEVQLGDHLLVPDIAGWKKERLPEPPHTNWCDISPDWICEVLSPSTIRTDRIKKMPIYSQFNVGHIWLIDPIAKTLEVFRLKEESWLLVATFCDDDTVCVEPFLDIEINLQELWW